MSDRSPRRTVLDSLRDAFRGIGGCLRTERNMRIHLTACLYVLALSSRLGLSRGEMGCILLAIGAVMSSEALNTALEKLCDFNQKSLNPRIRVVKDTAAGAVLLSALGAALVGVVILWRPSLWTSLWEIVSQPVSLCLFLGSLLAALVFIFAGPERIAGWFRRKE